VLPTLGEIYMFLHEQPKRRGGKLYTYYTLAKSIRLGKRTRIELIHRFGALPLKKAQRIRLFLKYLDSEDLIVTLFENIIFEKHWKYLDFAVLNHLWEDWELSSLFKDKDPRIKVKTKDMAKILTINRCLNPGSKLYVSGWYPQTAGDHIIDVPHDQINDDCIYRSLPRIEKHKEELEKHLFRKLSQSDPESLRIIFYDLSASYFEGTHCSLVKSDRAKEAGFKAKKIILSLLVNEKGYPFSWQVLEGDVAEIKTIKERINYCQDKFGISNITFVFDRGIASEDNLQYITSTNHYKYISALDRDQIPQVKNINLSRFCDFTEDKVEEQIKSKSEFTQYDELLYFQDLGVDQSKHYILGFNPRLFKDERKAHRERIERGLQYLKEKNASLSQAKRTRKHSTLNSQIENELKKRKVAKYIGYALKSMKIKEPTKGKQIHTFQIESYIKNPDKDQKIQQELLLDGLCVFISNHIEKKDDQFVFAPEKIIAAYRDKNRIEDAFKHISSFIQFRPIYVFKPEHVQAHYTICVLSYLLNITLTNRLREQKDFEIKSAISAYNILGQCIAGEINITDHKRAGIKINPLSALQTKLLKILGCSQLVSSDYEKLA